jgi:hypothetical protein
MKVSDLRSLIKKSKIAKKELSASTIRMSKELNSFIEGLAEHLSLSKQETTLKLIEEGVSVAENELQLNVVPEEESSHSNFHVLNTNKRNSIADHEKMLKNGIAAAFYNPWKKNIKRISDDDTVFLYENGVGIVAFGKGTGKTLTEDYNTHKDGCYYQILKNFTRLKKPLAAKDVKKILERNVVFLRTMSGMPDGKKVLEKILAENI